MKKRGQIYLIAALIIAALIIGLGVIYNYAKTTEEDRKVYDLSKEIDYEVSRVIDRGTFTGDNIDDQVKNLTEYYANLNPRSELVTIFGESSGPITAYHYKLSSTGKTCIQTGGCSGVSSFRKIPTQIFPITSGNDITVDLGSGITYDFKLRPGQNFYIVLTKEKDDEKFVVSPEREL